MLEPHPRTLLPSTSETLTDLLNGLAARVERLQTRFAALADAMVEPDAVATCQWLARAERNSLSALEAIRATQRSGEARLLRPLAPRQNFLQQARSRSKQSDDLALPLKSHELN